MINDIIRTEKLSKGYKNGIKALNAVSLSVTEGSRFVLLGPNGAGKSTLVRILSSLPRPASGSCSVCGLNPFGENRELMRNIGVATQENDLDPEISGRKLLSFQGRLFGMDKTELEEADRHAEEMALLLDGEIRFRESVDQFKRLGSGNKTLSLEEGYLEYLANREAFNAAD